MNVFHFVTIVLLFIDHIDLPCLPISASYSILEIQIIGALPDKGFYSTLVDGNLRNELRDWLYIYLHSSS